jgi:hypothetical protein
MRDGGSVVERGYQVKFDTYPPSLIFPQPLRTEENVQDRNMPLVI